MRKLIVYSAVLLTMFLFLVGSFRIHPYYRYATPMKLSITSNKPIDDTLRISIIGDSWAAYHNAFDTCLQANIGYYYLPVHVMSKGNVGAKSREIYERMFSTTKPLIDWYPDYCVIFAGINDAVAKLGEDFYVYHYMQIVRNLLSVGIKPVVIEIPDVDYKAIAEREQFTMRLHHFMSAFLMESDMYSFQSYRAALYHTIVESTLNESVLYVKSKKWNPLGYMDERNLYQPDDTHLNARGYHLLDSCIALEIIKDLKSRKERYE